MTRRLHAFVCVTIAVLFFSTLLFENRLVSYYSDTLLAECSAGTGSFSVSVENLLLDGYELPDEDDGNAGAALGINSSCGFSFSVKNHGISAAVYSLVLEIAWDEELSESGKLLVYPEYFSDGEILQNIKSGDFDGAVISANAADNKEIDLSFGKTSGISETAGSGALAGGAADEYYFKLFFYADSGVVSAPQLYDGKNIEINIILSADLRERNTAWATIEKRFFRVLSVIDSAHPVIREIAHAKTYFITQTAGIDLSSYAVATDDRDGDITKNIEITCSPVFAPDKAGTYNVTYTVKNSAGFAAVPIHIKIVIWNFVKIESGAYHALALTSHGKVYSWGNNYYGQLGHGTNSGTPSPKLIEGLDNIADIATGYDSSYALTDDGRLYSWGTNAEGQLGLGDNQITAINRPTKAALPQNVRFVQISSQYNVAAAVTDTGEAYTWGVGEHGALGNGSSIENRFAPEKINLSGVVRVEVSQFNGAAITKDGNLYTWGASGPQTGTGGGSGSIIGPTLITFFSAQGIKISDVSVGWSHVAATSVDGRLFTWGNGAYGVLGNGSESNKNTPQEIYLPSAAVQTASDYGHTGVLTADGTVYFFGQNTYGKIGNGNTDNQLTPVLLSGISNAAFVCIAIQSSFVLTADGTVYGMGYGGGGMLGTGNNNNSSVPVKWAFVPPAPHLFNSSRG